MKYHVEFEGFEGIAADTETGTNKVALTIGEDTFNLSAEEAEAASRILGTAAKKSKTGKTQAAKSLSLKPRQPRTPNKGGAKK